MKNNNQYINLISLGAFLGVWIIYLIVHFIDFITVFSIFSIIYELLISSLIYIINYLVAIIRYSLSYTIIFLIVSLFCIALLIESGYTIKFWVKNTSILKFNYSSYFFKDYSYFLLLLLNLSFFTFVFYYGFFYNIFIIFLFILFYLFLVLNIYLKYIIKKNKYKINSFNFFLNLILGSLTLLYLSILGDNIFKAITYKVNLTEYVLKTTQRKNRSIYKFQEEEKLFSLWNVYKNQKLTSSYLYIKNLLLKNNILNDVSNNKLKYKNFLNKTINNYYSFLNKENKIQLEKKNVNILNNNNNIYFENNSSKFHKNITNEIIKENLSKHKKNSSWFKYLLNMYNLKWEHYMPSDEDLLEEHFPMNETMSFLLKLEDKEFLGYDYSEIFEEYEDDKDDFKIAVNYVYKPDKFKFINNLLIKNNDMENYNNYIDLKNQIINSNIYKFDFLSLLKYKHYKYNKNIFEFINKSFLPTKKNKYNTFIELKYKNLSNIITKIWDDNLDVMSYKYNYLLNWLENKLKIKNKERRSTKYDALNKYLITEKDVLHFNKNVNINEIIKGDKKDVAKKLNTNNWLNAYLAPVDIIKKSIKSVDRNIFYLNIYKDIYKGINVLNLNYKENLNYYYGYLFSKFNLFKIKDIINIKLTFEKEKLSKEPFLSKDIKANDNETTNFNFCTYYKKPANFYYFFDYNNNVFVITKNVLYYYLEKAYYKNMNIIKIFNSKLLNYNKVKWNLYLSLIGFRYEKFTDWYYHKFYGDINKHFYKNKRKIYYYTYPMNWSFDAQINKILQELEKQLKIIYSNLYYFHNYNKNNKEDIEEVKQVIRFVVNNNVKLKEYFLKQEGYIDIYATYWLQKFFFGATIQEFMKFFQILNIDNYKYTSPYKFYNFYEKFKVLKNLYLYYQYQYQKYKSPILFSIKEQEKIYKNLAVINNCMFITNLAYDTRFFMTVPRKGVMSQYELLVNQNTKNSWSKATQLLEKETVLPLKKWTFKESVTRINSIIKHPYIKMYNNQLKESKEWSNWVFDSYKFNDSHMIARHNIITEQLQLLWDLNIIDYSRKPEFIHKKLVYEAIKVIYNDNFNLDLIYAGRLKQLAVISQKRKASEVNWHILSYLNLDLYNNNLLDDAFYVSKKTMYYMERYKKAVKTVNLELIEAIQLVKDMNYDMVARLLNIYIWKLSKIKEIEIGLSDSIKTIMNIKEDAIVLEKNVYILEDVEEKIPINQEIIRSYADVYESVHKAHLLNKKKLLEWPDFRYKWEMKRLAELEEAKRLEFEKKDPIEKYLLKKDWNKYNYQRNVQEKFKFKK